MAKKRSDDAPLKRAGGKAKGARVGRQLAGIVALLAIGYFAIEGGEYGTSDLLKQRKRGRNLRHDIDSLTKQVDSLQRYRKALASDIRLQERIAREEFGMVRGDKEILYRFAETPDTSREKTP